MYVISSSPCENKNCIGAGAGKEYFSLDKLTRRGWLICLLVPKEKAG